LIRPQDDIVVEPTAVTLEDGSSTVATFFLHEGAGDSSVVLCLPAMGVSAFSYEGFARALARPGLTVVTADLRGHGQSSIRASRTVDFGYGELATEDLPALVQCITERLPRRPLFVVGHSLGGQVAAIHAGVCPGGVDGLVLVSACSVHYRGWRFPLNLGVLLGSQVATAVATILGYFPGKQLQFAGREANQVMSDWAFNARTGRFRMGASGPDCEAALARVEIPVLAISFDGDALAPQGAVMNLLAKLEAAPVTHRHLGSEELGYAPDHFRWLKNPETLADVVASWIHPGSADSSP